MRAPSELALLVLVALAGGCTLERFRHDPCSSHAECRADFGFGAVCGPTGLCQRPTLPARCAPAYPDDLFVDREHYRKAIVLGSLMDLSSEAHVVRGRAARLAVKQAMATGGVDGHAFGLVECDIRQDAALDGQSRTDAAVAGARFLSDMLGVPAIIGPSASTDVAAVWRAVKESGTLVMSPAATSPALTTLERDVSEERPALLWRTAPSDSLQARLIAEDMRSRQVQSAVVLREGGVYGEALAALFSEHFTRAVPAERPGELSGMAPAAPTVEIVSVPSEDLIDGAVASLPDGAERPPEVLFISSQQSWVIRFLERAAAAPGFARRHVFLTDAAASQSVLGAATGAAALFPRVRGTRPAPRDAGDPVFSSFVVDYRSEYDGQDPSGTGFSAHAYDAAWLTLHGALWSLLREGAVTGRGIARGLSRLQEGPPAPLGPQSFNRVVSALRAGRTVDVSGASGELDFHPQTRELDAPMQIWTIATTSPGAAPSIVPEGMTRI